MKNSCRTVAPGLVSIHILRTGELHPAAKGRINHIKLNHTSLLNIYISFEMLDKKTHFLV